MVLMLYLKPRRCYGLSFFLFSLNCAVSRWLAIQWSIEQTLQIYILLHCNEAICFLKCRLDKVYGRAVVLQSVMCIMWTVEVKSFFGLLWSCLSLSLLFKKQTWGNWNGDCLMYFIRVPSGPKAPVNNIKMQSVNCCPSRPTTLETLSKTQWAIQHFPAC